MISNAHLSMTVKNFGSQKSNASKKISKKKQTIILKEKCTIFKQQNSLKPKA